MVSIQKHISNRKLERCRLVLGFASLAAMFLWLLLNAAVDTSDNNNSATSSRLTSVKRSKQQQQQIVYLDPRADPRNNNNNNAEDEDEDEETPTNNNNKRIGGGGGGLKKIAQKNKSDTNKNRCPYQSIIDDLSSEERYPTEGSRYIVTPPLDNRTSLICCQTTKGPWNIMVHHSWAPIGAQRFLDMIESNYFSYRIPLMRCVDEFICQFGLAGEHSSIWEEKIQADPQWLPSGDKGRTNPITGTKRFQKGYFAYAGSGPNTRGRQLFVSLDNTRRLGDGETSPWEVPFAELVGQHSFDTLDEIYTGYGENGPSQELLLEDGALDVVRQDFPHLDWILSCDFVDEIENSQEEEEEYDDDDENEGLITFERQQQQQ